MLEIISSEGERAVQSMKRPGIRHLAISVADFVNQGNRLVFFSDVDGNILHLIQRPRPLS